MLWSCCLRRRFFCCNTNLAALAQGEPTAEEVDDYLRDNGYSEEFIANTGGQTKYRLYDKKAVFQAAVPVSNGIMPMAAGDTDYIEGDWEDFSAWITVSDISTAGTGKARKLLTLNWTWRSGDPRIGGIGAYNDAVAIAWEDDDFQAQEETAFFEIFGTGDLIESYRPNIYIPELPLRMPGTFMTAEGMDAITYDENGDDEDEDDEDEDDEDEDDEDEDDEDENDDSEDITYAFRSVGVGYRFSIDYDSTFQVDFASESYGIYKIDAETIQGSYTIEIEKQNVGDNPESCLAIGYYFHWTHSVNLEFTFSFEVSLSTLQVKLVIAPDIGIEHYYERSRMLKYEFYDIV